MLLRQIPYPLRNTVEHLELPIYIDLGPQTCLAPPGLALGDSLMVLGLIRNQGRPLTLHLDPGPDLRRLVEAHPLVRELAPPREPERFNLRRLPVGRSGRRFTWISDQTYRLEVPVAPLDQIKANPILAHSLYYGLENLDDRPSLLVEPREHSPLAGLLSRRRPNLVLYPLNPGRSDSYWQDLEWWRRLIQRLAGEFHLVGVGADDYGDLALDAVLPRSDPASTLVELAWLIQRAQVFAGRDGGLSHLATAVNQRVMVVWDSMASYRYWAGRSGNHLVMSNPYTFRYPQSMRVSLDDLRENVRAISLPDGEGGVRELVLPREGYEQKAVELFGSLDTFMQAVVTAWEIEDDRAGVESWMAQPELKEAFYRQSLDFAEEVIRGRARPGVNWVAPVMF